MSQVVTIGSGVSTKVVSLLRTLANALGIPLNFGSASAFRVRLECLDGNDVVCRTFPMDTSVAQPTTKVVNATSITTPSGGATLDGTTGTATLVASTVTVAVGSNAVPVGSTIYATATAFAGNPKPLAAVRADASDITISSAGDGYNALLESAGVTGTCVAGTVNVALANVVGDRLSASEVTPGGTAAASFAAQRVNATTVAIYALNASGALVAGNTSIVKAYNFGQHAHDTSTVQWAVVRP